MDPFYLIPIIAVLAVLFFALRVKPEEREIPPKNPYTSWDPRPYHSGAPVDQQVREDS